LRRGSERIKILISDFLNRKRKEIDILSSRSKKEGPSVPVSMESVMDEWLSDMRRHVRDSTFAAYESIVRTHLRPAFGGAPVRTVTETRMADFLSAESARGLSSGTLRLTHCVLHMSLRYAATHGYVSNPPAMPPLPPRPRRAARCLPDRDLRALEYRLRRSPEPCGIGILLCIYTGLRVGEVCALRWGDIDPGAGTLTVHSTVQRLRVDGEGGGTRLCFGPPKSPSSLRTIPLPAFLRAELEPFRAGPDCFLLAGSSQDFMEPRQLQRRFKAILREVGAADINFHALRHTFATRCIQLGFDVKSLSDVLGHADVGTTLNTYVHPSMEQVRGYMEKLSLQDNSQS